MSLVNQAHISPFAQSQPLMSSSDDPANSYSTRAQCAEPLSGVPHKELSNDSGGVFQRTDGCADRQKCPKSRMMRFLLPLALVVVCLGAVGLVSCAGGYTGIFNEWNAPKTAADNDDPSANGASLTSISRLARAVAAGGADSGTDGNGVFVDQKRMWLPELFRVSGYRLSVEMLIFDTTVYLIIIFVGLVLVVIAGVMLSAWCCKGVFGHPRI